LDIITDGEQRRESYSNRFATALEGVDTKNPGSALNRSGKPIPVPRVTGKIRRKHPVELRDLQFLRANTKRSVKITVPGPFTMSKQAQNEFYASDEAMALDYAAAVNDEIKDLFAAGADIVQIDEPWMQQHPDMARAYGLKALDRALDGVSGTVAVHLCFGYAAVVHGKADGVLVSVRTGRVSRRADLDRSRAAEARPWRSGKAAVENDHPWRDRSFRYDRRNAGNSSRAHSQGAATCAGRPDRSCARLRDEVPAARSGVRQNAGDGAGRGDRASGAARGLDRRRLELGRNTRKMGLITSTAVPSC